MIKRDVMTIERAYSVLNVKGIEEKSDHYVVTGVATTPTADRAYDEVMPLGAQYKLPLPMLFHHESKKPIGNVVKATPAKKGIPVEIHIPKVAEAGALKDRIDEAVQSIKYKLVVGLSIGFKALEYEYLDTGGIRFNKWEWLELSLVTIPMNAEGVLTLSAVKAIDSRQLAASGRMLKGSTSPGVSGSKTSNANGGMKMDIKVKLAELEADFTAQTTIMKGVVAKAEADGRDITSLDENEQEEYDAARALKKSLEVAIDRTRDLLDSSATAKPISGKSARDASQARAGRIEVKSNLPKGTAFTRYAMALMASKGNIMQAAEIAKAHWHDSTPEVETVLRTAIAAGNTTDSTWAAPLVEYNTMTGEFIELLRPATIIGRIPGLRRVPFNISMPRQTSGASAGWVGEGKAVGLSKGAFDTVTLRFAKAAGLVVMTDELVRFSNPAAEGLVRTDLIGAMAAFLDRQFVDPVVAEVSNVSPASITYGVAPVEASGTDIDALNADFEQMFQAYLTANLSLSDAIILMTEQQAMKIGMMKNTLGQREFPNLKASGGEMFGLPVITSESAVATEDPASPQSYEAGGLIILAKASEIMLADDGQVFLDSSREASVQMDSGPDEPTTNSTVLVSLWQRGLVGLKAERVINWKKRRDAAVQYITGAAYTSVTA